MRQEFDEVEYTRQIYCLGMYYNNALVGIEANFTTYPIQELERLGYKKQYVRVQEDSYTHKFVKKLGFKTTSVSRPRILGQLQTIVLEEIGKITDRDVLEEMLTFVRNEKGRPEAQEGTHDDLVMGLAITYDIRDQQSFKLEPREYVSVPVNNYEEFGISEADNGDFGSNIDIV